MRIQNKKGYTMNGIRKVKVIPLNNSPFRLYDIWGWHIEGSWHNPIRNHSVYNTSPPYWGLRDYDIEGQIGLEQSLPEYINKLVTVFREVRRVLKDDGLFWLIIGDGYTSGNRKWRAPDKKNPARAMNVRPDTPIGLKPKDLLGVPWRLALALQDDGWFLRAI